MDLQSLYAGPTAPGFLGTVGITFFVIAIWSLIWKGMALWKAGREGSKVWFVVLLLVNTIGILDILYLYVFSKKSVKPSQPVEAPKM